MQLQQPLAQNCERHWAKLVQGPLDGANNIHTYSALGAGTTQLSLQTHSRSAHAVCCTYLCNTLCLHDCVAGVSMQTAAEASENNTTRTCGRRHPIKRAAKTVQMANMTNPDMEIVVHGLDGVWQDTGVYVYAARCQHTEHTSCD